MKDSAPTSHLPLLELILDEMFNSLDKAVEFDKAAVEKLKSVREEGNLTKANAVVAALNPTAGKET